MYYVKTIHWYYYVTYKTELINKGYGINFVKYKHYNIISHPFSHTKVAYLPIFLLFITQPTYLNLSLNKIIYK
jgi:hypothetical protein